MSYESDIQRAPPHSIQGTYDEKFTDNIDTVFGTIKSLLLYIGKAVYILMKKFLDILGWVIAFSFYEKEETRDLGTLMIAHKILSKIADQIPIEDDEKIMAIVIRYCREHPDDPDCQYFSSLRYEYE